MGLKPNPNPKNTVFWIPKRVEPDYISFKAPQFEDFIDKPNLNRKLNNFKIFFLNLKQKFYSKHTHSELEFELVVFPLYHNKIGSMVFGPVNLLGPSLKMNGAWGKIKGPINGPKSCPNP